MKKNNKEKLIVIFIVILFFVLLYFCTYFFDLKFYKGVQAVSLIDSFQEPEVLINKNPVNINNIFYIFKFSN